jgi:Tol biopolymer transport system component
MTGTLSRVTSEHDGHDPVWSPDGKELLYTSIRRSGTFAVYRTRPGSGVTTKIAENAKLSFTGTLLRDGRTLFTQMIDLQPGSQGDLVRIDSAGRITPVVAGPNDEAYSAVSPDGRWVAFTSGLTGTDQVYVRPLSGNAEQMQVSRAGGTEPMWSPDGHELFYRAETDGHTVLRDAVVDPRGSFRILSQSTLFAVDEYDAAQPHANYDVAPDGRSFVMVHRAPTGRLAVIQNLPELVRRLQGIGAR